MRRRLLLVICGIIIATDCWTQSDVGLVEYFESELMRFEAEGARIAINYNGESFRLGLRVLKDLEEPFESYEDTESLYDSYQRNMKVFNVVYWGVALPLAVIGPLSSSFLFPEFAAENPELTTLLSAAVTFPPLLLSLRFSKNATQSLYGAVNLFNRHRIEDFAAR